jgi:hypothetical protein
VAARIVVAFAAVLGLAAGAPPAPADPLALVNSLYVHKAAPAHVERLFAADLAAAYRRDTGHPGEVGAIDFDWRYDAQDVRITDLKVFWGPPAEDSRRPPALAPARKGAAVLPPVETPAPRAVEASFRNFGKPRAVFYSICRTARGELRIADVYTTGRDRWSLRRMLKLDPEQVRC